MPPDRIEVARAFVSDLRMLADHLIRFSVDAEDVLSWASARPHDILHVADRLSDQCDDIRRLARDLAALAANYGDPS